VGSSSHGDDLSHGEVESDRSLLLDHRKTLCDLADGERSDWRIPELDVTNSRTEHAGDDLEESALPRSVGADQRDKLTAVDFEIDLVQYERRPSVGERHIIDEDPHQSLAPFVLSK